jgi:hypothetical protein
VKSVAAFGHFHAPLGALKLFKAQGGCSRFADVPREIGTEFFLFIEKIYLGIADGN